MSKCLICGSEMKADNRLDGLVRCPNCRFVSADMTLSKSELEDIYAATYFKGRIYTDYTADEALIKRNFARRLSRIRKVTGNDPKAFVLEIGCAYGFFLDSIRNDAVFIKGIDISKDAVRAAQERMGERAEVCQGDYLEFDTEPDKYDMICMWDTIEHLSRPDEYLKKAGVEMKKGGFLCLTTGDIESLNAKLRGSKWRHIHPPEHLHYFSKKTISELLEKNGFVITDFSYIGNELSLRNVAYQILCLRMGKDRFYDKIKDSWITDMSISINLHDYMFVIAKKS